MQVRDRECYSQHNNMHTIHTAARPHIWLCAMPMRAVQPTSTRGKSGEIMVKMSRPPSLHKLRWYATEFCPLDFGRVRRISINVVPKCSVHCCGHFSARFNGFVYKTARYIGSIYRAFVGKRMLCMEQDGSTGGVKQSLKKQHRKRHSRFHEWKCP